MKNLIRNILKEELNIGDQFLKMINNEGLLMVCRACLCNTRFVLISAIIVFSF